MTISQTDLDSGTIHHDSDVTDTPVKDISHGPCTLYSMDVTHAGVMGLESVKIYLYDNDDPTVGTTEPIEIWTFPDSSDLTTDFGSEGVRFDETLSYAAVDGDNDDESTPGATVTLTFHFVRD